MNKITLGLFAIGLMTALSACSGSKDASKAATNGGGAGPQSQGAPTNASASDPVSVPADALETKETILNLNTGSGNKCPDISGTFSCKTIGTDKNYDATLTWSKDSSGRSIFVNSADKFLGELIDDGEKIVADGSVQTKRIRFIQIVTTRYAVDCSEKVLSLHLTMSADFDTGTRTIYRQQSDGGLQIVSRELTSEGKIKSSDTHCSLKK